ncbi:hypothetical protein ABZ826_21790 [Streptomyces sp. NPDC047515]|uniref:hypothetical protein n=1 Tax=Streptomyces sp. NPDC047515 TaxID=3155380 RepID=UPI0033FA648D
MVRDAIRHDQAVHCTAFLAHVRDVRKREIRTFFSVGYAITEPVRRAVRAMPDRLWHSALGRYRQLHVTPRLTRGGRRLRLRTSATWPWRYEPAMAFHRLAALPRPAG